MLREGEPYDSCGPIGSYFALRRGIWIYRIKDGCMEKGSIHACYCPHASIPTTALGLLPSIALSSELADGKYHRREFFQQKKDNKAIGPAGKSGFQPKKCSLKNVKISLDMGSTSGFRPLYSSE